MKIFKIIFGAMLFCNVAGVGMELYSCGAEWASYFGLLGSVVFGYYVCDVTREGL